MGSVKKTGDWNKVHRVVLNLDKDMRDARTVGLMQVALKAERIAVKHIQNQDLNWQGLESKTKAQKSRKGQSDNILIASTDYIQSITRFTTKNTAFAGVKKDTTNRSGDDIISIAAVHEFGSRDIPARPLWKPTSKETEKWIRDKKLFASIAVKNIKNRT